MMGGVLGSVHLLQLPLDSASDYLEAPVGALYSSMLVGGGEERYESSCLHMCLEQEGHLVVAGNP